MIDLYPTSLLCYRCHASTWEAVDSRMIRERGRDVPNDLIECCFCGVLKWVAATRRPVAVVEEKPQGEFRFQFGRFKGLTIAETDAEENGRRYLEYLRDNNERMRERIGDYLDRNDLDTSATDGQIVHPTGAPGEQECHERRPSSQRLFD